jgi:hypothetical protein
LTFLELTSLAPVAVAAVVTAVVLKRFILLTFLELASLAPVVVTAVVAAVAAVVLKLFILFYENNIK